MPMQPRSFCSYIGLAAFIARCACPKGGGDNAPAPRPAVRQLVLIANDNLIAGILNRNGLATGYGNRWTRERALRCAHIIAS